MLKKILKTILISFVLITSITTNVSALTRKYYTLNIDGLTADTKKYVTSVVIEDDTKNVFINNVNVGTLTSDPQTFSLTTTNYKITAKVSVSNLTCNISVDAKSQKNYKSLYKIELENNQYYVCYFYPDSGRNSYYQKLQSVRNGDEHNFNSFSYTYGDDETKTYNVKLIQSTGAVYINGDYVTTLDLKSTPVVFEYLGNNFPLDTKYVDYQLNTMSKYNWADAQANTIHYSDAELGNISVKEEYKLSNTYLNLPSITRTYGAWVNSYKRVSGTSETGTGEWESQGTKIKVICEYHEDNECGNAIRKEFSRYWSIRAKDLPDTATYKKKSILISAKLTTTKEISYYPTDTTATNIYYSTRTSNWSEWKYTADKSVVNDCEDATNCEWKSATRYRYRLYTWSSWSDWGTYLPPQDRNVERQSKAEYSDWYYGVNQSGSYTDQCEWKYYTNNYSCGYTYVYSNYGPYEQSKYGYTDKCNSRTGNNSECGVSSYTYSNYGSYRTSKYGYTSYCNSRSGRNSECGSENKSCTRYYCATSRTCTKKVLGICTTYSYSNYKYAYGSKPSPAYNCSNSSVTSSSCGTQNKSCTSYSCAQSKSPNYAKCTSYSCAKTRNTEYSSCYMWNCPHTKTTLYRYRTKDYGKWSKYEFTSCPTIYSDSSEVECESQNGWVTHWATWSNWSSWISTSSKPGTDTLSIQYKYKYDETKSGLQSVDIATKSSPIHYNNLAMLTYSEVVKFQQDWASAESKSKAYDDTDTIIDTNGNNTGYKSWADVQTKANSKYNEKYTTIVNRIIYSPYLYYYGWRFEKDNFNLPQGDTQKYVNSFETTCYLSNGQLIESEEQLDRKTKVIYFDYHDPLTNYSEIPENWKGYESLLNEIKNSDMSNYKIKVKISGDDLIAMKKWIKDNPDKLNDGSCEILRQFSYIFIDVNPELAEWLSSGDSCEIKEEEYNG